LRVSGAGRRVFNGSSDAAADPMLRVYLADMVAPFGVALREDLLAAGAGQSYGEMADAVIADVLRADQPVDLIVAAFAVSDVVPGRATAAHLSFACPGSPAAFAVCDQGNAAPYTALRMISEYARTDGCSRALLIVTEQATLHYEQPAPAAVPARNVAIALVCGQDGSAVVDTVRVRPEVGPEQVGELLAQEAAALAGGRDDVTLIAGAGLDGLPEASWLPEASGLPGASELPAGCGLPAGCDVLRAPAGQPCTGVWWELAGGLPGWLARGRRVLLADYEPVLGYLCLAAIDVGPPP
jgi:hypothetical protein